ncbi:hypothetical protein Pla108_24800 [Botrimarina colliarenosi]|uniref:Zinc-finger domain-containing protein n=1 Tax=Botrimarina colliarenosi TaxID=2528001 RepID=A0A5C6AB82_9BACT|nr:hypothetical protein [Botrimarina colliarenosi]TWT96706.1 hypothetical protein Pla108_24800 [Botrimarina colliarenosi]
MNPANETIEDDADGPDEVLVAYLDGQLSAEECECVESLLARDATTRQRLQTLDRVWNALDVLPRSTASPTFTRTTIDMAAVTAEQAQGDKRARLRWRLPFWAVASVLGVIAGAMLTLAVATSPERRAVRDLPVALHAPALEQVGSLDFLNQLVDGHAATIEAFDSDATRAAATEWAEVTASTPQQRHGWVAELSPAELATVNARLAEYQGRTDEKQASLRRLSEEIAAQPNVAELREAALAYEAMVDRLPATMQSSLRQMPARQRLRLIEREAPRWSRDARLELSGSELADFRKAIDRLTESAPYQETGKMVVQTIRVAVARRGSEPLADRVAEGFSKALKREPKLLLTAATEQIAGRGDRRGPLERWFADAGRVPGGDELKASIDSRWRDWVTELEASLPAGVVQEIRDAERHDERARIVSHLLRQTEVEDDLPTAFARIDVSELDSLLLKPTDEFRDELSGRALGGADLPPPFWGEGPPPGGRPGRDGERRPPFDRGRDSRRGPPGGLDGPPGFPPPRREPREIDRT